MLVSVTDTETDHYHIEEQYFGSILIGAGSEVVTGMKVQLVGALLQLARRNKRRIRSSITIGNTRSYRSRLFVCKEFNLDIGGRFACAGVENMGGKARHE